MSWFSKHPVKGTAGIVILAGGVFAIFKVAKLLKFQKDATINIRLNSRGIEIKDYSLASLSLGNAYFYLDIIIDYPGENPITLKNIYIKLFSDNVQIGNNIPDGKSFDVKLGRTIIPAIPIIVPVKTIIGQLGITKIDVTSISNALTSLVTMVKAHYYKSETTLIIDGVEITKTDNITDPPPPQPTTKPTAGLGLTAGRRNIQDGSKFNSYFPPSDNKDVILDKNASVEKTVSLMADMVNTYNWQTAKIAPLLKGRDTKETCDNIWKFIYKYIQYSEESGEKLRTPARSWAERKKGIDCDCMAIFAACILKNLGIDYNFRITKYNGRGYYQHVYVIVPTESMEGIR